MRKVALLILITLVSTIAFAGNGAPSGSHYNLNIIGVEKGKKADMTGSNRHSIFVPLVTSTRDVNGVTIGSQIWLAPSDNFRVCDGNGFDAAYGCADNPYWDTVWDVVYTSCIDEGGTVDECVAVSRKQGAVFELPCNTNIPDDQVGFIPCDTEGPIPYASYEVWARALGSPKGDPNVSITTCATVQDELQCSTENVVKTRTKGNTPFTDVTSALTSAVVEYCVDYGDDDVCDVYETTRIALFSGDTEDWFWNYINNGVRLLQLRFYPY